MALYVPDGTLDQKNSPELVGVPERLAGLHAALDIGVNLGLPEHVSALAVKVRGGCACPQFCNLTFEILMFFSSVIPEKLARSVKTSLIPRCGSTSFRLNSLEMLNLGRWS